MKQSGKSRQRGALSFRKSRRGPIERLVEVFHQCNIISLADAFTQWLTKSDRYRGKRMLMPNNQFFIAQSGRSAWKWLVMTFILGWFSGIVTVAVLSMTISHAHAEPIAALGQPWLIITGDTREA
jgi:hypothetical protein